MYNVYEHGKIFPIASYILKELAEQRAARTPNSYVMFEPEDDYVEESFDDYELQDFLQSSKVKYEDNFDV